MAKRRQGEASYKQTAFGIIPLADYNGRIGRLLISIILLNLNLPPIELKAKTTSGRKRYIHALQAVNYETPCPPEF